MLIKKSMKLHESQDALALAISNQKVGPFSWKKMKYWTDDRST